MLGALRRCSAAFPRTVSSISTRSVALYNNSNAGRLSKSITSPIRTPVTARTYHATRVWQEQEASQAGDVEDGKDAVVTRFEDLELRGMVNRSIVRTLTNEMKMENMTEVQTATINEALKGTDMYDFAIEESCAAANI